MAFLGGFFAVVQGAKRHLAYVSIDRRTLNALGLTGGRRAGGLLLPMVAAALVGALVGAGGAVALSPLFPIGSFHGLDPHPGIAVDFTGLLAGSIALFVLIALVFGVVAWRADVNGAGLDRRRSVPLAGWLDKSGTLSAVANRLQLASRTRAVLPQAKMRSVTVCGALTIAVSVGGVAFADNLQKLAKEPARYGQAFDLQIEVTGGESADASAGFTRLVSIPGLDAVSRQTCYHMLINHQFAELYVTESLRGPPLPVILEGRAPVGDNEIAIGPALARKLRVGVGGLVEIESVGASGGRSVRISGIAFGTSTTQIAAAGGLVTSDVVRALGASSTDVTALVAFAKGTDHRQMVARLDAVFPYGVTDESSPLPPSNVARLQEIRRMPFALALFLGLLALVALVHALTMLVRRRRTAFAVLRALGSTPGQVTFTVVVVVGFVSALIAVMLGAPAGLSVSRTACARLFAGLDVLPGVRLPVAKTAVIDLVTLAVAFAVALFPALSAARHRPADALRGE